MPGFDDAEIDLVLERYHARNRADDSVEERWRVDAEGLDRPCAGDTPSEALRVLADSLEHSEEEFADIDELLDAEPENEAVWGDA
ncbi:hypothetical protein [Halorubrum aethiopicum]|uniref:hypothetical protein n=1 Tax=Halorubrum aethiopicum TaxID=1758255 RepID=UPI000831557D|nr:hypothetical protein [Halorubrum aethiopicum]